MKIIILSNILYVTYYIIIGNVLLKYMKKNYEHYEIIENIMF